MTNPPKTPLPPPSNRERLASIAHQLGINRRWEILYPWIFGVLAGVSVFWLNVDQAAFEKLIKDVAPAAISVAAIFAGFQGAIHAILLTMLKSKAIRMLRQLGLYDRLIGFVWWGIASLTLHVTLSLAVLLLFDLGKFPARAIVWITSILTGLFMFSLLASMRIVLLEVKILGMPEHLISEPQ